MRERNWASYIRPISARYMHAKEVQQHQRYHETREISADADLGRAPAIIKQRERIKG